MNEVCNQAEIISIGTELLMGEIIDTNAKYLARELRLIGVEVGRATTAGDDKNQLTNVFLEALSRSDLVLASGGLGPTDDDLTRECLAEALGEILYNDKKLEQELRDYFSRSGWRHMPSMNLRQAALIPSARSIRNPNGTAPGWWVGKSGKTIVLMPGPPREMEPMWQNEIRPRLAAKDPGKTVLTRTLKVFGMGEASVNELTAPFFHLENPTLGIYAKPDGIHLRLISRGSRAQALIEDIEKQIRGILQEHVWGTDADTLPDIVGSLLIKKGLTLSIFDAGTSGAVCAQVSNTEGYSRFFRGSIIAGYAAEAGGLGMPADIMVGHGKINAEGAVSAAEAACHTFNSDIGLGITGITGIDGADGETAGAAAFIGIKDSRSVINLKQDLVPRRDLARDRLAVAALFHLRKRLLE